jgi:ADP-ribose pyrophosphatase
VSLPEPPKVELAVVRDRSNDPGPTFLRVKRYELVVVRGGTKSAPFVYDVLDRTALDACVMLAHHEEVSARLGTRRVFVWMRSAIRPPIALRGDDKAPHSGSLWELPAGLIEPGESAEAAAARELGEELGFEVAPSELKRLGPAAYPAPGFIGELHHFFHVRVDPRKRVKPAEDGSPLEEEALVVAVPLDEALDACRAGTIHDEKTELALRRLADQLP